MHRSTEIHYRADLLVLMFIKSALDIGLLYRKHTHLCVHAFSDSKYASDKLDRSSIIGYCTYIGGNMITWRSKKQSVDSHSSTQVEYQAIVHSVYELMWLEIFL